MRRTDESRKRGRGRHAANVVASVSALILASQQLMHSSVDAAGHGLGISDYAEKMRQDENLHSSMRLIDSLLRSSNQIQSKRRMSSFRHLSEDDSSEDFGVSLGISTAGKGKGATKSTKKSQHTRDSSKRSKKESGKGKGRSSKKEEFYDDDYYGGGGGEGSGDGNDGGGDNGGDDGDDDVAVPTAAPVIRPSLAPGNVPSTTSPNQVPVSMAPIQIPPSNREPPTVGPQNSPPTSAPTQPRCLISDDGLFGSAVGLSEEFKFYYQVQVIPSVTASEMNLNVLIILERSIGERVLPRVFDQCVSTSTTARAGKNRNRHLRTLQGVELQGFSTRPRDTVIDGVECVNVEQVYPCYVIRGQVTAYSPQPLSPTTIQRLQAGLRAAIDSDQALTSDTRVIDVSWRDITSDPIPGEGDDGGGDSPTMAPASAPSGDVVPIVRETKRDAGFETWGIALIATACTLCLCMAYLCLRRGQHEPIFDSEEGDIDAQGGDSASSDHFSHERTNSKERTPLVAAAPVGNEQPGGGNQVVQATTPYRDPFIVSSGPSSGSDRVEKVQDRRGSPNQMEDASRSSGSRSESESESSRSESGSQFEDEYGYESNGPPQNQSIQQSGDRNNGSRETRSSPKSGGEVFSAEYSEVEVDEEYEVEYVDEDEDHNDEGSAEYEDEYDDNDDDDDYEEDSYADDPDGIVVDSSGPGGTPILPWLARDD